MTDLSVFLFATLGGIAMNLLRLVELTKIPRIRRPETFRDPLYLVQFFVIPLIGGALAYAYKASGISFTPILAINIGVCTPLIFKSFADSIPSIGVTKID